MTAFPVLYETVINTEDLHVGRVPWCPNTFYSPAAKHEMEMHSYFRSQVAITIDPLMTAFVKYAYDHGMDFEVEVDCPLARCTDANARFCEYVVRRKGSPEYVPPVTPADEEAYVEFDMGDEDPLCPVDIDQTLDDPITSFTGFRKVEGLREDGVSPSILIEHNTGVRFEILAVGQLYSSARPD